MSKYFFEILIAINTLISGFIPITGIIFYTVVDGRSVSKIMMLPWVIFYYFIALFFAGIVYSVLLKIFRTGVNGCFKNFLYILYGPVIAFFSYLVTICIYTPRSGDGGPPPILLVILDNLNLTAEITLITLPVTILLGALVVWMNIKFLKSRNLLGSKNEI